VVKHTLLKKRELLVKDPLSQRAVTLPSTLLRTGLCPLASRLTPWVTLCHALPS